MYQLYKKSEISQARSGVVTTAHGEIKTPFFMPIATKAAVKTLTISDIAVLNAQILLSNTYHLYLRPGLDILKKFNGLRGFMNWNGPILTDSGGYQVFSLAGTKNRNGGNLVKVKADGVEFRSHIDGSKHLFTPEKVLDIQKVIGSDIMMILDVCTANPATHKQAEKDLKITYDWAQRAKEYYDKNNFKDQNIFAIVQGSTFSDLRVKSARELVNLDFDGYAIGGLAVGETHEEMYDMLDVTVPELPEDKPRYLMGVGRPENIIEAVKRGVDMFDCVIPTREARHGRLYVWQHDDLTKPDFYKNITITNAEFKENLDSINPNSKFAELREYSFSYLNHLFDTSEPLALRIATLNNLEFYLELMAKIREQINSNML